MSLLDPTYGPKVHKKDNGDTLVVEAGGQILLQAGAKIGPSGSTATLPIASANQANVTQSQGAVTLTQDTLVDNTGGVASTTLAAETTFTPSVAWNGSSVYPSAADASAITAFETAAKNAIASLAAELNKVQTDIAATNTALTAAKADVAALIVQNTAFRAALVSAGLIKGSA